MLAKRIIPCLDVNAGRVVKGVNFVALRDAGDPIEIARRYDGEGADELTFLDITASSDRRDLILHVIEGVAEQVFIPLTVGGGVRRVDDVRRLLNAGADKVSINTSAVQNPELVAEASARYGAQCIVVAIDARRRGDGVDGWEVYTLGGRWPTRCPYRSSRPAASAACSTSPTASRAGTRMRCLPHRSFTSANSRCGTPRRSWRRRAFPCATHESAGPSQGRIPERAARR